jgi:hypothetical protein
MIRDSRKDAPYFSKYLAEQDARISKFQDKAKDKAEKGDETAAKKAYMFSAGMLKDKLFASYSAGNSIAEVKSIFEQWVADCDKSSKLTYAILLDMVSLAILLKPTNETLNTVKRLLSENIKGDILLEAGRESRKHSLAMISENIKGDILLEGLYNSLIGEGFTYISNTFKFENNYIGLRKVLEVSDKATQTQRLAEYISEEWYNAQSDSAWHNSHLGKNETYVGYWAFECAALAVALSLDLSKLKKIEYIPADLL